MLSVVTLSAVVTDELVACDEVEASEDRLIVPDAEPGAEPGAVVVVVVVVATGVTVMLLERLVLLSLLRILANWSNDLRRRSPRAELGDNSAVDSMDRRRLIEFSDVDCEDADP